MLETNSSLFEGRLVRLAAPRQGDSATFARWSEDSAYLRTLDTDYARPITPEEFARRFDPVRADPKTFEFRVRTLEDDTLIGFVALHSIEWNNRTALLAIGIGERRYQNRGYGTDALHLVLRYAFHELNLFRVGLNVVSNNTRAIHVYSKAGFRQEGRVRCAVLRDGKRHDLIWMGILRSEWHGSSPMTPRG